MMSVLKELNEKKSHDIRVIKKKKQKILMENVKEALIVSLRIHVFGT